MKQFRRRFIVNAMLAFTILLVLIIGGIVLMSYIQLERDADDFINQMLKDTREFVVPAAPPMFGYQPETRMAPAGFCDLSVSAEGQILRQDIRGISEPDRLDLTSMVEYILSSGKERGKVGIYKFGLTSGADETRIILLDNSVQMQALYSMLRSACMIGMLCLALMFLILQPIAAHAARANLASQERERQFITNASHEMKTPVAVIQSNIEAMELMCGETKWSRNIHHQALRLNHLIAQLLLLERMDEQALRGKAGPVDLAAIIQNVSEDMQELLAHRGLTLRLEAPGARNIRGYQEALVQLIHILLDNAARYAQPDTQVVMKLSCEHKAIRLVCENQVVSLPNCPPEQLFARFHRGGIARQEGDMGCGIGLSAAGSIAALHRGRIEAIYPDEHTFRIVVKLPNA